jgi:hypothetical protein
MNSTDSSICAIPKLALNRVEAAQAIGQSPATIDRLTKRGLLRPCRATRRPLYAVKEIERFLKATTPNSEWTV